LCTARRVTSAVSWCRSGKRESAGQGRSSSPGADPAPGSLEPMSEPQFVVEDVFVVTGRGPVITRSDAASREARDRGELFENGDVIRCGGVGTQVIGIESFCIPNAPQGGLLLRGVALDQLAPGQVWVREPPPPEV
jgi:hypothetical protein